MNFFKGRIDRKTYIAGMAASVSITIALTLAFILPLAMLELAIPAFREGGPNVLDRLVLVVPTIFIVITSFSLLIRRAHDMGSDGLLWLIALFLALVARVLLDSAVSSILPILVLGILASLPGNKKANRYGRKPSKKFDAAKIYQP
jgi:uncharacterized membrane protein YhaH (DUF805 family)